MKGAAEKKHFSSPHISRKREEGRSWTISFSYSAILHQKGVCHERIGMNASIHSPHLSQMIPTSQSAVPVFTHRVRLIVEQVLLLLRKR